MEELAKQLREQQESHERLGPLYGALHGFADRLVERYFSDVNMPPCVISFEKDRRTKLGHYRPYDGYTLTHAINLNIWIMKSAVEAAETLAHELVHLWQVVDGHPCQKNFHGDDFHGKMLELGIETRGPTGMHVAKRAEWLNFLEENQDLELEKFVLPGVDLKPRRQLNLFHCKCEGGNPIRSRKMLDVFCNECQEDYEYVPPSARSRRRPSMG
jgi:hypothetical protein